MDNHRWRILWRGPGEAGDSHKRLWAFPMARHPAGSNHEDVRADRPRRLAARHI